MGTRQPDDNKGKSPMVDTDTDMVDESGQGLFPQSSPPVGSMHSRGFDLNRSPPSSPASPPAVLQGQGFPSAIPQPCNRKRELELPPVDSSKKIVAFGRSVGRRSPRIPRPSSPALPPVVLQGPSHGSVTGNILPGATDYNMGQVLFPTAIPQPSLGSENSKILRWGNQSPRTRRIEFQDPSQPSGQICMLCNREVMFEPSPPPVLDVLPCGHVFHDECLQNVTPKDQVQNPPCFLCANGEK